jgi:hypothetical protein
MEKKTKRCKYVSRRCLRAGASKTPVGKSYQQAFEKAILSR